MRIIILLLCIYAGILLYINLLFQGFFLWPVTDLTLEKGLDGVDNFVIGLSLRVN